MAEIRTNPEKFKPMFPNIFAKKALNSVAKNKAIIGGYYEKTITNLYHI